MDVSVAAHTVRVQGAALSDVGRKRQNNEDAYVLDPEHGLFAVADGMGGQAAGEVASAMAVSLLQQALGAAPDAQFLSQPDVERRRHLLDWMATTVAAISQKIYVQAETDGLRGMGCTLDAVLVRGSGLFLAHVGDSRAYLLRRGTLYQLTEDHTLGQLLFSAGALTREELATHPQRNALTRALGPMPTVQVDTAFVELSAGDVVLLCSDGLYGEVPLEQIQTLLGQAPQQAVRGLVDAALEHGGRDNVTAVVFTIDTCSRPAPPILGAQATFAALVESPLFAAMNASEILRVQKSAIAHHAAAGTVLYREGEDLGSIFLLVMGQLSVWRGTQRSGRIGPGDPFGELSARRDHEALEARIGVALSQLNPRYRRAIELRFLEERERADCAEAMEVKLGTFDVLVLRALRAFRKAWDDAPPMNHASTAPGAGAGRVPESEAHDD